MVATHLLADAITLIARIPMRQRSSYPKTFKAQVAQECRQPVGHSLRRRHQPRHQRQRDPQVAADLPRPPPGLPAFVPVQATAGPPG